MVSVTSDGAKVFQGRKNGVISKLQTHNNKILALHCSAHAFALVICKAYERDKIFAYYDTVLSNIYNTFKKSCVCSQLLQKYQISNDEPKLKMKKLFTIRWLSRQSVLLTVARTYKSLVETFKNLQNEGQNKVFDVVFDEMTDIEFLLTLFGTLEIMDNILVV